MNLFMEQQPTPVQHRARAIPLAAWFHQAIGTMLIPIARFGVSTRTSRFDNHQELQAPLKLQVAHKIAGKTVPDAR